MYFIYALFRYRAAPRSGRPVPGRHPHRRNSMGVSTTLPFLRRRYLPAAIAQFCLSLINTSPRYALCLSYRSLLLRLRRHRRATRYAYAHLRAPAYINLMLYRVACRA